MFGLCKYKDLFGKPKQGVHSTRIFDLAVMDIISTIVGGFIIGYIIRRFVYPWWSIPATIMGLFVAGIILHRAFCVRTTVDKLLFPNVSDS